MASDPSVAQQNDETATAILRTKKRYVAHSGQRLQLGSIISYLKYADLLTLNSPNKLIVDERSDDDSSGEFRLIALSASSPQAIACTGLQRERSRVRQLCKERDRLADSLYHLPVSSLFYSLQSPMLTRQRSSS
jgi:hypothetical protein